MAAQESRESAVTATLDNHAPQSPRAGHFVQKAANQAGDGCAGGLRTLAI